MITSGLASGDKVVLTTFRAPTGSTTRTNRGGFGGNEGGFGGPGSGGGGPPGGGFVGGTGGAP